MSWYIVGNVEGVSETALVRWLRDRSADRAAIRACAHSISRPLIYTTHFLIYAFVNELAIG